jgi:hypothetical protein
LVGHGDFLALVLCAAAVFPNESAALCGHSENGRASAAAVERIKRQAAEQGV